MPTYFFDVEDNGKKTVDSVGLDCPKLSDVRYHAIDCLADMARSELPDGPSHMFTVHVRDQRGAVIFNASLELKSGWVEAGSDPKPN